MQLTDGEKLILVMLGEIYEKLGISGEIDPKFVNASIFKDHIWGLRRKYYGIYGGTADANAAVVDEVISILVMWQSLESAYEALPVSDQESVKRAASIPKTVRFEGFDANNETEHYSVINFLVHDLGEFVDFKERDLNTHYPVLDSYRRMRPVFEKLRGNTFGRHFNSSELAEILNARMAPVKFT